MGKNQNKLNKDKVLRIMEAISPLGVLQMTFLSLTLGLYLQFKEFSLDAIRFSLKLYVIYFSIFFIVKCIYLWHKKQILKVESLLQEKENELEEKVELITNLKRTLKNTPSSSQNTKECLCGEINYYLNVFKFLMDEFWYIESIQLYDYNVSFVNDNTVIRINHFLGSEYDDIDIKVNKQKYFSIEKEIFTELCSLCTEFDSITTAEEKEDVLHNAFMFCISLIKYLNRDTHVSNKNPDIYKKIVDIACEIVYDLDKDEDYSKRQNLNLDDDIDIFDILTVIAHGNRNIHHTIIVDNKVYLSFLDSISDKNRVVIISIRKDVLPRHVIMQDLCEQITNKYDSFIKKIN